MGLLPFGSLRPLIVFFLLTAPSLSVGFTYNGKSVHTVFGTECGDYFNWQSIGMIYSHMKAKQPGPLTRLLSCTPEQAKSIKLLDVVNTHVAPSYTKNPHNDDIYSAYNKPESIISWLENTDVKEEYVLILDADMVMRATFTPDEFQAEKGHPVSAFYGYLKGVGNELALKHIPEVPPTNDFEAGPFGRRGDQVGGFILMATEDLRKMAPMWLSFAEAVRMDPDAWNLTGDVYSAREPHSRPWISEMYGYSFGAAKAGLHHKVSHHAMLYPEYMPQYAPRVLHYGLFYNIPGTTYKFDKHWYRSFEPLVCSLSETEVPSDFLFPFPPHPSQLKSTGLDLLRDLLGIETPATLNEAICWWHRNHCKMSPAAEAKCSAVDNLAREVAAGYARLGKLAEPAPGIDPCTDASGERCIEWAGAGECERNPSFMMQSCRKACKVCSVHPATASSATTITSDAATDAHTALSTSIKKHAAAADHIDAAAVRENGEGEGEGKAQALAAGGSVGSGTRAARGLGAEAKGAGDDELEGVGGRRGTEGEDQQGTTNGATATQTTGDRAAHDEQSAQPKEIQTKAAEAEDAVGHAAVKAAVGAAVQRAAAQGVKPAAGARGADAGAQPLVVTRVRARGSEDPTFKVIKPGGQNARHSAFHFGRNDDGTFEQPSILTGLSGALNKFARTSSIFVLFFIVLLLVRRRSSKAAATAAKSKPLLPTYQQMRGAGPPPPPGVYAPGLVAGTGGGPSGQVGGAVGANGKHRRVD